MFGLLIQGLAAHARYEPKDAELVDQADPDFESTLDRYSFSFPREWDLAFEPARTGYRATAGSFNIHKFYFHEQLKFASDPGGPLEFRYEQSTEQDLTEETSKKEAEFRFRTAPSIFLSVIGYVDREKKYGDIGGALAWSRTKDQEVRLYYLAIDPFYNAKEVDFRRRYEVKPWEAGLAGKFYTGSLHHSWELIHESKLSYRSEGYRYERFRRRAMLTGKTAETASPRDVLSWQTRYDVKGESKTYTGFEKALERRHASLLLRYDGARGYHMGLIGEHRIHSYDYAGALTPLEPVESSLERKEYFVFGGYRLSLNSSWSFLSSLYGGHVVIRQDRLRQRTEVKPVLSWEYRMSGRSYILLNTTFDLDQLVRLYPYKEQMPAWDGGNIQVMLTL